MKMPKMPKCKTLRSLKNYEEKLDEYAKAKQLEKRLQDKRSKIK
jgi:hypothetical protein